MRDSGYWMRHMFLASIEDPVASIHQTRLVTLLRKITENHLEKHPMNIDQANADATERMIEARATKLP